MPGGHGGGGDGGGGGVGGAGLGGGVGGGSGGRGGGGLGGGGIGGGGGLGPGGGGRLLTLTGAVVPAEKPPVGNCKATAELVAVRRLFAAVTALLPANTPWLMVQVGVATGAVAVTPVTPVTPPIASAAARLFTTEGLVSCATRAATAAVLLPWPLSVICKTAGLKPTCVMVTSLGSMPVNWFSMAAMYGAKFVIVPVTPANVRLVLTKMSVSVTTGGCVPRPSVEATGASCAAMLAVQLAM